MASDDPLATTLAMVLGAVLVVLGVAAYVLTEFASITALIPAFFGIALTALGNVGREMGRERLSVYGIGVVSLLGVVGSLRGVPDVIALLTGDEVDSTVAAVSQGSMILLCLVLLASVGKYLLESKS